MSAAIFLSINSSSSRILSSLYKGISSLILSIAFQNVPIVIAQLKADNLVSNLVDNFHIFLHTYKNKSKKEDKVYYEPIVI